MKCLFLMIIKCVALFRPFQLVAAINCSLWNQELKYYIYPTLINDQWLSNKMSLKGRFLQFSSRPSGNREFPRGKIANKLKWFPWSFEMRCTEPTFTRYLSLIFFGGFIHQAQHLWKVIWYALYWFQDPCQSCQCLFKLTLYQVTLALMDLCWSFHTEIEANKWQANIRSNIHFT